MTITIDSPLRVDEAMARLRRATVKRHWIRFLSAVPGTFEGSAGADRFTLLTSAEAYTMFGWTRYRNLARPVCTGRFHPAPNGSQVVIKTRPQAIAILQNLLLLAFAAVLFLSNYRNGFFEIDGEFRWAGLLIPGFSAIHFVIQSGFAREMRHDAEDAFRKVFEA